MNAGKRIRNHGAEAAYRSVMMEVKGLNCRQSPRNSNTSPVSPIAAKHEYLPAIDLQNQERCEAMLAR